MLDNTPQSKSTHGGLVQLQQLSLHHSTLDYSSLSCLAPLQAKHQPLQFLNVSTLREYLRFEFLDLVGKASEPPPASDLAASDPWHQGGAPPEPAPGDANRAADHEGSDENDGGAAANAPGPDAASADVAASDNANSVSPSLSHVARPVSTGGVNADGHFEFERVLQDFVLLTFLVSLPCSPSLPPLPFVPPPVPGSPKAMAE